MTSYLKAESHALLKAIQTQARCSEQSLKQDHGTKALGLARNQRRSVYRKLSQKIKDIYCEAFCLSSLLAF